METPVTDTRPQFSRITEGPRRHSWRAALPAVVVLVVVIALIAYLASALSSSSQKAATAERDAQQYRDQVAAMTKQVGDLQKDISLARSPGRTTVIIEAAQSGKKTATPANRPWAVATWGELPNGKSWMRVNAYGLSQNLEGGKTYHLWMVPQSGDAVDVGAIDIDQNGSGLAMKLDLPGVDQGKAVMLTIDGQDAKQPGETIAKADLPKLQPTMTGLQPQAQEEQKPPASQAKPGSESQQMHKGGK